MKSILHLFNPDRGSRYPLMLSEAMIKHPDVAPMFSHSPVSLGHPIASPTGDLQRAIEEADLILRPEDEHFGLAVIDRLLAPHWGKVALYDYRDSPNINRQRLEQCRLYVKRTPSDFHNPKMLYLDYGILDEYINKNRNGARIVSVSYLFSSFGVNEENRKRVLSVLKKLNPKRAFVGYKTTNNGRRAILEPVAGNPFMEYLGLLQTSKIVVTCSPDHGGGDSRLWEAFSSGALVVCDRTAERWGFVDGEHCLIFNECQGKSIHDTVVKALDLTPGDRERIAQDGQRFALENHLHVRRFDEILKKVGW